MQQILDVHPFDRVLAALRARGCAVRMEREDRARCQCPGHQDTTPSLTVTRKPDKTLMICRAGCSFARIVEALGLRPTDLFIGPRIAKRAEIVAVYDYTLEGGQPVQKVRTVDKQFWWRRAASGAPGKFRRGLDGPLPGLYRLEAAVGASSIHVVEGEKAVDRLRALGLTTTCPPAGASTWKPEWSTRLLATGAREIVILADHDRAGEQHADRVAADLHRIDAGRVVKVLRFSDLPAGADVVDFLEVHAVDDLAKMVASAPTWAPGAIGAERRARKAEQARRRFEKWRATHRPPATRPAPDSAEVVLDAIVALVTDMSRTWSGVAIKSALAAAHGRNRIEQALEAGEASGRLTASTGPRGAFLYRPASVATPGRSSSFPPGSARSEANAPDISGSDRPSQLPATRNAATQPVRRSVRDREIPMGKSVAGREGRSVANREARSVAGQEAGTDMAPLDICCGERFADWTGRPVASTPACKLCPRSRSYWRRPEHEDVGAGHAV